MRLHRVLAVHKKVYRYIYLARVLCFILIDEIHHKESGKHKHTNVIPSQSKSSPTAKQTVTPKTEKKKKSALFITEMNEILNELLESVQK